jgi:hypothetical protein
MEAASYTTRFGSLADFESGGVEIINDDPRHYAFSNIFDVANRSKPYEKVAVGKNMQYVLEAIRAEGVSEWRVAAHDEFALVMDGRIEITLVRLDHAPEPGSDGRDGSVALDGEPVGQRMGRVIASRGHQTLLPAGTAYRFSTNQPGVILLQTLAGADTQFRWAEICQSL